MKVLNIIFSLVKTSTIKQSFVVFNGSMINGILGAVFYILMARSLGPSEFGLFVVTVSFLTLIADVADIGTNTGLVKFVSANLINNREKSIRILKLSLEIKLAIWLLVMVLGMLAAPLVATTIFNKKELILPLRLAVFGVGGALLFSFATSSLQAFQRFFSWSIVNVLSNSFRLILIFLLIYSQQLNLNSGLIVYIALPFLGFFLASLLLPTKKILTASDEFQEAKDLLNFNRWVAFSTICAAVSSRMDTFLNTRLLSTADVGIYGAANQLTSIAPQIIGALGIVAAPKFASFSSLPQMLTYFKKFQFMVLLLAMIGLLGIPISYLLIPILFGVNYLASIGPFIILLFAMLIFLISTPLQTSIYYYFSRPDFFARLAFINLIITSLAGYFLISSFGVIGAAFTVLIGMSFNFLVSLIWFLKKIYE